MKQRILVVEDDRTLRQALVFNLEREGYEVRSAVDGEQALAAARDGGLDLLLLDLMLPGMSGLEVLRTMRADGVDTPVVILSAKGGEVDRVVGLKVGADDYIPKPFSRPELLARVESVLRRQRRSEAAGDERAEVRSGSLAIDPGRHLATFDGEPLRLTTKEFELLAHLAIRLRRRQPHGRRPHQLAPVEAARAGWAQLLPNRARCRIRIRASPGR